jgi:hypothetical protein
VFAVRGRERGREREREREGEREGDRKRERSVIFADGLFQAYSNSWQKFGSPLRQVPTTPSPAKVNINTFISPGSETPPKTVGSEVRIRNFLKTILVSLLIWGCINHKVNYCFKIFLQASYDCFIGQGCTKKDQGKMF